MEEIEKSWSDFKTESVNRGKDELWQYVEKTDPDRYVIWFYDSQIKIIHVLYHTSTSDKTDFDSNYKNLCNSVINPIAAGTKAPLYKPKPVDGTLWMANINFITGDNTSLKKTNQHTDKWSIDTNTDGKTFILFEPDFSFYIDGGALELKGSLPVNDVIVNLIFAPDPPQGYPGNQYLIDNYTIFHDDDEYFLEAPPKYIKYYGGGMAYASNIKLDITHGVSDSSRLHLALRIYI